MQAVHIEVLEQYMNIGPIADFCVVDLERRGQGQVITCSGAYKDGSIREVRNGIVISDQASVELQGVKGLWSLKSSSNDLYDTFLVVTFINETRFLAMNMENELEEADIEGFDSQTQILVCGSAIHNQLIQVTAKSVRLVSSTSRELLDEWFAPTGLSVNVAAANASQVLLATGGGHIVYLEITNSKLVEVKRIQLEHEISCLDINPIGENPQYSSLAAVGMWTDISVTIFSLPSLKLIRKENLGEVVPRSVLLCTIEGVSYMFCALGDGHLFSYVLNISTCELSDRSRFALGTQPTSLRKFSSKDRTHVFAASDRPTVIYRRDKKLLYSFVNLKEVSHACPFNTAVFPESLAIAKEAELSIGTINDIKKLHIRTIPLNEQVRRICHQEQSRTLAFCSFKDKYIHAEESETHFVRLLDHQTFGFLSTYTLDAYEYGRCIISCSFSDDDNCYYCVGTAYLLPKENEPTKHEEGLIEEVARDRNTNWMSAVEMLNDDIYIGADNCCNLFTVRNNNDAAKNQVGKLEVVGEYHLGDLVKRFHHGSMVMHHPDSEIGQIPTVIFGTTSGSIGVIASLPNDQYVFLEKLQSVLVKFIKSVGNLRHAEWRSFYNVRRKTDAWNFVDGDLIESFLRLSPSQMEVVAQTMGVPVDELCKKVEELAKLHFSG